MTPINAFTTPAYPVIFCVLTGDEREAAVPEGHAGIALALLVDGQPSFFATHVVPEGRMNAVVMSLEEGDVRVAVVGASVEVEGDATGPAAFVSLVCADGRRLTVARILGRRPEESPERLARHVVRAISRGVQIPELAETA